MKYSVKFEKIGSDATTLPFEYVCDKEEAQAGFFSRLHANGWTISGLVHEDYYYWVNSFEAHHPVFGRVWGDFEEEVFADSEEGYAAFYECFPPDSWDYWDI